MSHKSLLLLLVAGSAFATERSNRDLKVTRIFHQEHSPALVPRMDLVGDELVYSEDLTNSIHARNLKTGEERKIVSLAHPAVSLSVSQKGLIAACVDTGTKIMLFDLAASKLPITIELFDMHNLGCQTIRVEPDSTLERAKVWVTDPFSRRIAMIQVMNGKAAPIKQFYPISGPIALEVHGSRVFTGNSIVGNGTVGNGPMTTPYVFDASFFASKRIEKLVFPTPQDMQDIVNGTDSSDPSKPTALDIPPADGSIRVSFDGLSLSPLLSDLLTTADHDHDHDEPGHSHDDPNQIPIIKDVVMDPPTTLIGHPLADFKKSSLRRGYVDELYVDEATDSVFYFRPLEKLLVRFSLSQPELGIQDEIPSSVEWPNGMSRFGNCLLVLGHQADELHRPQWGVYRFVAGDSKPQELIHTAPFDLVGTEALLRNSRVQRIDARGTVYVGSWRGVYAIDGLFTGLECQ